MDETQQNFKKAIKMVADHIESILLSLILFISYALLVFTNADAVAGIVFILPMVTVALTRGVKDEFDTWEDVKNDMPKWEDVYLFVPFTSSGIVIEPE